MNDFVIGARYVSVTEPELGLGILLEIDNKHITVTFPASEQTRRFTKHGAPITRARFEIGDEIKALSGLKIKIETIAEQNGLYLYQSSGGEILEPLIAPEILFQKPEDKLLAGKIDRRKLYFFRLKTLKLKKSIETSPVRGLIGPKINLLPHQLFVAKSVLDQPLPRVLLADEVGLGKTIEAGLILHALTVNERSHKALVIVPFALVNQWFIELKRLFKLNPTVVNKVELLENNHNPFAQSSLVVTSLEFITKNKQAYDLCLEQPFDMIIIDEAHRLQWSDQADNAEYDMISEITKRSLGLLLLSATPEKFGNAGHFARLRLIDPHRFHDYEKYLQQMAHFEDLTKDIEQLTTEARKKLVDEHGTGRVLFRNTRENIDQHDQIFAKRQIHSYPLEKSKTEWLLEFLKNTDEKVLLLTRTKESIHALERSLEKAGYDDFLLFYSELPLIERDRNAEIFKDVDGPQLLICSEIGSEGRNFQFCHHLVFFDLPQDPDIVEQRIGRLDRIGQKSTINIHLPYIQDTFEEILFHWFHQGMEAFTTYVHAASYMFSAFEPFLKAAAEDPEQFFSNNRKLLNDLTRETKKVYAEAQQILKHGQNKLISLNSYDTAAAKNIIEQIHAHEENLSLQDFLEESFNLFGIQSEEIKNDIILLTPTDNMVLPSFPGVSDSGTQVSFNRTLALKDERLEFLSSDHPMVIDLMDLVITQSVGNVSAAKWSNARSMVVLEVVYKHEVIAAKKFSPKRFCPTSLIRVLISLEGKDLTSEINHEMIQNETEDLSHEEIQKLMSIPRLAFKELLRKTKLLAQKKLLTHKEKLLIAVEKSIQQEYSRLENLKKNNPSIREDELNFLKVQWEELKKSIDRSDLNLDGMLLVIPKS